MALTGTPGVGKTTVSSLLADVGYQVETVQDIAQRFGCIDDVDSEDGARPIDIDELNTQIHSEWKNNPIKSIVIDGHLSLTTGRLRCYSSMQSICSQEKIDWEIICGTKNLRQR